MSGAALLGLFASGFVSATLLPGGSEALLLYLASDAGGFTTGQTIVVDGGTLISDGS